MQPNHDQDMAELRGDRTSPGSVLGHTIGELASAVHDQRYGFGLVTAYLRDPQVENLDVNGCD